MVYCFSTPGPLPLPKYSTFFLAHDPPPHCLLWCLKNPSKRFIHYIKVHSLEDLGLKIQVIWKKRNSGTQLTPLPSLPRRESGANAPYLPLLLPLQFSAGIPTGHIQSDGRRQSESLDAVPTGQPSEPRAGLVGCTAQKWRCVDVCSSALWPHCRLPASLCLSATETVSVRGKRWELSVLCCSAP